MVAPHHTKYFTGTTEEKKELEWRDSLFSLLAKGRGNVPMVENLIVVDNAKAHRSLSECQNTISTTPSSSTGDSNDYRDILDSLPSFVDGEEDGFCFWKSSKGFHHSFPGRKRSISKTSHAFHRSMDDNFCRWASSSDSEIGRITLDDMLREDEADSPICLPRRPVRQQSMDGLDDLEDLEELEEISYAPEIPRPFAFKDHCPVPAQRQQSITLEDE